jgi:hypothetical protein
MSTVPRVPDVSDALARVESLLAGNTGPQVPQRLDPACIRWVSLVPVWTPTLATRCGMPGWTSASDVDVLAAWRAEGLIESMVTPLSIDDAGQVTPEKHLFWVPRNSRAAWLSQIEAEDGRDRLAALARDIAGRILIQPRDRHMPPATWRWAVVTANATGPTSTLRDIVERELTDALAHDRPDEAWLWIEALQRVAEIVPGEATTLHQRAVRRLALFDRQRNDRAMLRDYLPRPALFAAYRELLTGPDDLWAVHYLGGGGVGKTMLMRALTSGTAEHVPPGFEVPPTVTARIDFDHINPDYPSRRPGLLFAQLAEELRLKDDSLRASENFGLLFNKIALLHERVGREPTPAADIDDMLDVFRWACEGVARQRGARVVLLLDTCEELDRLGPDGALPNSVERTFDLLERLHAKMPALRVVLCGRRPLAGAYAGGEAVTSRLPSRPWLRLHRVFAFSEAEARDYLGRAAVPETLVPPVLSRSVAAGSSAALGLAQEEAAPRYSPFSLSVYATWIAKQHDIGPETILNDRVDHFVRIRILDRIHNEDVRRLLPHVALLGRFDDTTLRACVDVRSEVADAVLREIGSQEWIDRQAGGYYAVEPELRARLIAYFEREAPRELQEARRRLLPQLWTLLDAGPADRVPDEAVVQALVQMVRGEREGLLRAWRILDTRVVHGIQAAWGMRVLGRLLADEAALAAESVDAGAWGAFVTTFGECAMHEAGAAATPELWRKAWEGAQELQEPYERASVLVRIASGALASASTDPDTAVAFDMWALRLYNLLSDRAVPLTAPSHLAPAIAALMACADAVEREADPLAPAQPLLERMAVTTADVRHAPARAIALTCVGRFAARRQDADLARKRFQDALEVMAGSHDRGVLPCLQWRPRLDAPSWVSLEAMRGLVGLETVEETLARFDSLPAVRSDVAANRLESLRMRLTAALRVPEMPAVASLRGTSSIVPGDVAVPEHPGQVLVRPRAVAIALDHVETGRADEGLRLLAELTSVATSARNTEVANVIERARIEAVTRLRLGEHGRLNRHLLATSEALPLADRERMRAFIGDRPLGPESTNIWIPDPEVHSLADVHATWRARRAFDDKARHALADQGKLELTKTQDDSDGEWARASVALDLVECSELGADVDIVSQGLTPVSPEDWWSRHPARPELALRLWMRSAALGVAPGGPTTLLVRRVGVRRAAAIAMEEGELLALRLPTQALRLLSLSLTWFEDAHDLLGAWQLTILLALTRVRAGVPRDSIDLTALRVAHEALVGHDPARAAGPVPPWPWIEGVQQLPLADAPGLTEWAPWLHRVIALHHWITGGVRPEVLFSATELLPVELCEWPSDASAGGTTAGIPSPRITSAGTAAVPARPQPAPGAPASATPPAMPLPPPESAGVPVAVGPAVQSSSRRLGAVIISAGLVMLLLLWWWLARPAAPPAAEPRPADSATKSAGASPAPPDEPVGNTTTVPEGPGAETGASSSLAVGFGLLAAVGLFAAGAWLLLRSRTTTDAGPGVIPSWLARVTATGTEIAGSRVGALDVSVALVDDKGMPVTVAPLRIRKTDAFSGLDALRQPPTGTALSTPLPTNPPLARVWLDLALPTSWPCWEALLWSGVVTDNLLRPTVVRMVHASRPARQATTPPTVPWPIASVAATAGDDRQASYAWESALRAGRATLVSVPAHAVRGGVPHPGIRLVHVTAQPVETPQGLFFEAFGGETMQYQETLESLTSDRGTLFDGSQLAHAFPDMTCALLQPPRRPALDLTSAGRETCAHLRMIGAALAEEGVSTVIILPPLDGELSAHLVRLLGRRIPYLRDGADLDAHEFASRAREIVFGHAQRLLARDAAIELALQVTVYAPVPGRPIQNA